MATNTETPETARAIAHLEEKLAPMVTSMETLSNALLRKDSAFYDSFRATMTKSLGENEGKRREIDAAIKQHEEVRAANKSAAGPDKRDPDYYDKLFAMSPGYEREAQLNAQRNAQAEAIKKALSSREVREMFNSSTIRDAMGSNVDSRTVSEKMLDKVGLGSINRLTKWVQDRNIRKEEKATRKDQAEIKRAMEERARLAAKYRTMQESGASDEKLAAILAKIENVSTRVKTAESRIDRRRRDPYDDLVEAGSIKDFIAGKGKKPGGETLQPAKPGNSKDGRDTVEIADMNRKLKTKTEPEFYEAGTEYFRAMMKAGGGTGMSDGNGLSNLSMKTKALGLAAAGAILPITQLAKGLADAAEQLKYKDAIMKDIYDKAAEGHAGMKNGVNDARRDAEVEFALAKKEMYQNMSFIDRFTFQGGEDNDYAKYLAKKYFMSNTKEEQERMAKNLLNLNHDNWVFKHFLNDHERRYIVAHQRLEYEKRRQDEFMEAARKAGVDDKNIDELQAFYEKYINNAVKPGKDAAKSQESRANEAAGNDKSSETVDVAPAETPDEGNEHLGDDIKNPISAKLKTGIAANLMPRIAFAAKVASWLKGDKTDDGGVKMGAGSMEQQSEPTAQTPGADTNVGEVYTVNINPAQIEEATYLGTKRALIDSEVRAKNEELARVQGQEINNSLVGR